jgi:hypothetical protein
MYDAYEEIMDRIEKAKVQSTVIKVLSWLCLSRRPLNIDELCEALSIRPFKQSSLPKLFIPPDNLVRYCQGLITIDEESGIVRFTHYTVQEFFRKRYTGKLLTDAYIASVCLTYLNFNTFELGPCEDAETLDQRRKQCRFTEYAVLYWGVHLKGDGEELPQLRNNIRKLCNSVAAIHQCQKYCEENDSGRRYFDCKNAMWVKWKPIHCLSQYGLSKLYIRIDKEFSISTEGKLILMVFIKSISGNFGIRHARIQRRRQ